MPSVIHIHCTFVAGLPFGLDLVRLLT